MLDGHPVRPPTPVAPPVESGAVASASPTAPEPSSPETTPAPPSLPLDDAKTCAVTRPGVVPSDIGDSSFGSDAAFGNTGLWVGGLGEQGVIVADSRFIESDGSIAWKLGWYRIVSGSLTISGRRLDADAPPLRSSVPGAGPGGLRPARVDRGRVGHPPPTVARVPAALTSTFYLALDPGQPGVAAVP